MGAGEPLPRRTLRRIEAIFDTAFGPDRNPFHFLGALTVFFFWVAVITGLYLFLYFELNIHGAYHSIEYITHEQWYLGGIMRSLHRYTTDAAVITMTLHLVREFILGRYSGFRWYTWFTGVPLLWFVILLGITGHWLVWDQLAQYIAIASAEFMDWWPWFGQNMARNFITEETLSDRFFTLMAFLHMIGIPVMLLFGIWFHISRLSRPIINPPRHLALGTVAAMLVLALVRPAVSHEFADLGKVPDILSIDWFYLWVFPLIDVTSPGFVWTFLAAVTLGLSLLPLVPRKADPPAVEVNLDLCNGCGRCVDDCPYDAVRLHERQDGRGFIAQAVVDPDLCAGCGICVGACPYSTPFRRSNADKTGIDLPGLPLHRVREDSARKLSKGETGQSIIVYGCDHGVDISTLDEPDTVTVSLPCIAMLPPSMIDFALRRQDAAGVMITGCAPCDCHYRLGNLWMEERIEGTREPHLHLRADPRRMTVQWASAADAGTLREALQEFRGRLSRMPHEDQQ
jgi:quinol-cytochrome oxidoreductase complex cytochrome b subunit/coenzyme F420-reducing hydrogenase delta subunit/ferredoxin